jgi:pimeloyl-ACP methyl ester carboxylesterase
MTEKDQKNEIKYLVVIIHGYAGKTSSYSYMEKSIRSKYENAKILIPRLQMGVFSNKDPNDIAIQILDLIDQKMDEGEFDKIIIVGNSCGALIARKVYVCACGENVDVPFEDERLKKKRLWSTKVERIILLAGINRGWSKNSHLSVSVVLLFNVGYFIFKLLALFKYKLFIFKVRRGSPFVTMLRLQWLSMLENIPRKSIGNALVIQLLGTIDDLVSPDDNIDLVTGANFYYLDMPQSGHKNIILMNETKPGIERKKVFVNALTYSAAELEALQIHSFEYQPLTKNDSVTDVVFVIHGIRDGGYWTRKIASKVQKKGAIKGRVFQTETSSYGYFPMLPFLLPSTRREKVEWLMDQYIENKAQYPNAEFSFVGHSNGTYLLAKALKDYPACKFKNVVFAGSVVSTKFDWPSLIETGRIEKIVNFIASADWVVAVFPNTFQKLRLQDLGSAGHNGFSSLSAESQLSCIQGNHGAGVGEGLWDHIADFIVTGAMPDFKSNTLVKQNGFVKLLGHISPLIFCLIIVVLISIEWIIWHSNIDTTWKIFLMLTYPVVVWKVITKL